MNETHTEIDNDVSRSSSYIVSSYYEPCFGLSPQRYTTDLPVMIGFVLGIILFKSSLDFFQTD